VTSHERLEVADQNAIVVEQHVHGPGAVQGKVPLEQDPVEAA
jgi:hypothetical protein